MFETRHARATSATVENLALAYSIVDSCITPLRQSRMYANVAGVQSGTYDLVPESGQVKPGGTHEVTFFGRARVNGWRRRRPLQAHRSGTREPREPVKLP